MSARSGVCLPGAGKNLGAYSLLVEMLNANSKNVGKCDG